MSSNPAHEETTILSSETTNFGGYEILSEVARGGMGVVYKARELALDRLVALKLVRAGTDASDSELSRFQVEAKAAARLDHPHIVPVYGIGEHQGQHYFSMGFVDGPSLSVRLAQSGPLPPREAAEILRKVAEAVDYAHRRGVIHRDLKPGNVLLTSGGEPKVTDFGLAKRLESDQSLTATGQVFGTPAFMSPEQAQGDHEVIGPASDVYSLGATLFAALTGRPPFTSTVIHELLIQVTEEPPPSLRTLNARVPAALEAICLKCLAKSPADRYPSAGALAEDLGRFLGSERVVASRQGGTSKIGSWAAAIAVVVIAVIGGVWFRRERPVRPAPVAAETPDVQPTTSNASPTTPQLPAAEAQLLRSLDAAQDALLPSPTGDVWQYRYANGAAACEQAFREFGFTVDQGDPSQLAELLQRSSPEFRESVLCGLELWEQCATVAKQTAVIEQLRQAQDSLDTQSWRRSLRLARTDADEKIILQITRDALTESPTPTQIKLLALLIASRSPETTPEALDVLRSLLQKSPKSLLPNLLLASTLQALGRAKPKEMVAYASESVIPLRVAAKARPTFALPHAQLAAVFTSLGNNQAAVSECEQAMQLQYPEAWPLIVAARKARENKQYLQAITLIQEALAKHPDVFSAEIELAATLILNGQDTVAEPLLRKIAQNAPDDGAAYQALQEIFQIVELAQTGTGKQTRELRTTNHSSLRAWDDFFKYRRNQSVSADSPPPAIAPFDAEQAKQHQAAWAKSFGVPVEYTNSIGIKFRLIPPGEFLMGSTPEEIDEAIKDLGNDKPWQASIESEAPQHKVVLTQPIYLGVYEVTQAQYEQVTGKNPSHFAPTGAGKNAVVGMNTADHPVEDLSWNEAAEFCAKLSEQEKLKPFYFRSGETVTMLEGTGYRLPTEAEWEFACRAGTTTKYWIGDDDEDLPKAGWFGTNAHQRTHAVGTLRGNPFGLYDIHGNVWEWVQDWWEPPYYRQFQRQPAIDPRGPSSTGSRLVFRGGDFHWHASACRASSRSTAAPTYRVLLGFRVALVVDAVKAAISERQTKPTSDISP